MSDISALDSAGKYLTAEASGFPVFICSLPLRGALPAGAVDTKKGFYLAAYSQTCTHLGCRILPDTIAGQAGNLPSSDFSDFLVTCRCHFSTFDLLNRGMTVQGPATDFLSQVELRGLDDPLTQVELVGWIRMRSVPYGVPFSGTSAQPPEKP